MFKGNTSEGYSIDVHTRSHHKDDGTSGVAFVKLFHIIAFGLQ